MSIWNIKARNAVNGTQLEERVEAESAEAAKDLFLAGKPGMSIDVLDVIDTSPVAPATEKKCPKCAELVKTEAQVCRFCGYSFVTQHVARPVTQPGNDSARMMLELESRKKSVGIAVVLNLVLPGAGYAYCGRVVLGLIAFIFVVVAAILTGGFAALGLIPIVMVDGALVASRYNKELTQRILASE